MPTDTSYGLSAYSVALSTTGRIVVAGYSLNNPTHDFAVACLNSDGSLDTSFGNGGKVTTDFNSGDDIARSVVIQPDGKIVVAGYSDLHRNNGDYDFAVARYNANGTLDSTFGVGGKVTITIGNPIWGGDYAYRVALGVDGAIIVSGSCATLSGSNTKSRDFAVAKLNPNGSLDTTFSSDGVATTTVGNADDQGLSNYIYPDGKILIGGWSESYVNGINRFDYSMVRFNSDGSLDNSFGNLGKIPATVGTNLGMGWSMAVQRDGKIIQAGNGYNLQRYNGDGTVDTSFGNRGSVAPIDNTGYAAALLCDNDGKILVGGGTAADGFSSYGDFLIVRFNSDGSLDSTFNQTGQLKIDFDGGRDYLFDMKLRGDGVIVAVGFTEKNNKDDLAVALIGTQNGDSLAGTINVDKIYGNGGDDLISGGTGADYIDGGAGADTASFSDQTKSVVADLSLTGSVSVTVDGKADDTLVNIENLIGGSGNDVFTAASYGSDLTGGAGNDTLNGGMSTDTLYGGDGNDVVNAGAGNDLIVGGDGAGDDTYNGGDGIDTVKYTSALAGIKVDLSTTVGTATSLGTNDASKIGIDKLTGIENIIAGNFSDIIIGSAFSNVLEGQAGDDSLDGGAANDTLFGGEGNDTLVGGKGDDIFWGGNGTDTAIINAVFSTNSISSFQNSATLTVTSNDGIDVVNNDVEFIRFSDKILAVQASLNFGSAVFAQIGTDSGETLTGTSSVDMIQGNGGDDKIYGLDGNDSLDGGLGNDTIDGGAGIDCMSGGSGNDLLFADSTMDFVSGGDGTDTVQLNALSSPLNTPLIYNLGATGNASFQVSDIENLTYTGTSNLNATGNALNNVMTGSTGNDNLDGGAGNDFLIGGVGDDTLIGGLGNDTADGGLGIDIYLANDFYLSYSVKLNNGSIELSSAYAEGIDTIRSNVETIQFKFSPEIYIDVTASTSTNRVVTFGGASGQILVSTIGGNDAIYALGGDDYIWYVDVSDTVIGGDGFDILTTFATNFSLVEVAGKLTGVEGLVSWAGTSGVTFTGNASDNFLVGGLGNDTLSGGLGNDTFYGSGGIDTVLLNVNATQVQAFAVVSMDSLNRTGIYGDTIYSQISPYNPNGKAIQISTSEGVDRIAEDIEYIKFSDSKLLAVQASLNFGSAVFAQIGTDSGETLTGTSSVDMIQGNGGDDKIYGLDGNDSLDGGLGNDTIDGGIGMDSMNGGAGDDVYLVDNIGDVVSEASGNGTDTVRLSAVSTASNIPLSYTLGAEIENLTYTGTSNLNVTGNALNNVILGAGANDTLDGGMGIDTLTGGAGDDVYYVDNLKDVIVELVSDHTSSQLPFSMGNNNDVVVVAASASGYVLKQGVDIEDMMAAGIYTGNDPDAAINMTGNELAQGLIGNNANNLLKGMGGNDDLVGMDGNDTLWGGEGRDLLAGGKGNDSLMGEAGDDLFLFHFTFPAGGTDLLGRSINVDASGGYDTADGGAGTDTVLMSGVLADYTISRASATQYRIRSNDGTETMLFTGVEKLVFGDFAYLSGNSINGQTYNLSSIFINSSEDADWLSATGNENWSMDGRGGNDTLYGGGGSDTLYGGAGSDKLYGGKGDDWLTGFTYYGEDEFAQAQLEYEQAISKDSLYGGAGNDMYAFDENVNTPTVVENINEGIDSILGDLRNYVLPTNVENYVNDGCYTDSNGAAQTVAITGNSSNNLIKTSPQSWDSAATILNTTSTTFDSQELFRGMGGNDTLIAGAGNDSLYGDSGNDRLDGGAGNDYLDGGTGTDVMLGGSGNDMYVVDSSKDVVTEGADEGNDVVYATVSYTLGANIENLFFQGGSSAASGSGGFRLVPVKGFTGTGNELNNRMEGSAGADVLKGGEGNDSLHGGFGSDTLTGGAGDDVFIFSTPPVKSNGYDRITDFTVGQDKIQLETANMFKAFQVQDSLMPGDFISGNSTAHTNEYLIYNKATGGLYYDHDASGSHAAVQIALLANHANLQASDFWLV